MFLSRKRPQSAGTYSQIHFLYRIS